MTQRHWIQCEEIMLITTCTKNRVPIFSEGPIARVAIESLYATKKLHPFNLFGFIIMPDHCHFLILVDKGGSISKIMNSFKSACIMNTGIPKIWQRRFHIRIVKNAHAALNYIHKNPVTAELSETEMQYPWSSASDEWVVDAMP